VCSVLREMPPCTSRGLVMRPTRDFILPSSLLGPHSQPLGGQNKRKGLTKRPFFPILDFSILSCTYGYRASVNRRQFSSVLEAPI
jgi:hypothetical protein